ncbi:MAG TPA: cytochrome c oxidase subunit II [Caulobacteraceae bacterium]|nr:cytochrome c oxidase subunit II [Caulobacteraceae bacterium]
MKASGMGIRGLAARAAQLALGVGVTLSLASQAMAEEILGQPTDKAIGLQAGVTPLREAAISFHNHILLPIITAITLLVLVLLSIVVLRFNKRANPVPAKWSHNTPIEVVWTVLPVMILAFIAIFSFRLLFTYHTFPEKPYMTVKATGYQWYWGYEYPDQKIPEIISNILPEDQAKARGAPYRLAATEPLVAPVGKVVRVLVTGNDVIHAFAVPSFGIIADAIPGKINETWFKADRIGTFYGQCRELCGIDHAFMPIEVKVVSQADFDAWVKTKAKPSGGAPPTAAAATNATAPTAIVPATKTATDVATAAKPAGATNAAAPPAAAKR